MIDTYTKKHGTQEIAEAYLRFLYTEEGQRLCAKHFYRPSEEKIAKEFSSQFTTVQLFRIDEMFGGWTAISVVVV